MARKTRGDGRPDLSRYPGYIQDYVTGLERDLKHARERIAQLSNGPADSNVRVSGVITQPDRLLGSDEQIDFYMGRRNPEARYEDTISIRHERQNRERTSLRVEGTSTLHIIPSASNSFRIVIVER